MSNNNSRFGKSVRFGNKKALQIISYKIKEDIKKKIKDMGTFNTTGKYYNFLNKKNISNLKSTKSENDFLVTLSTFGKKYVLFLTNYNEKKYCIFINKKNESMILSRFRFSPKLFSGTLLDGEFVKDNNGKWIFFIADIAYYMGENIITKPFNYRKGVIDNFLKNEYKEDTNISVCTIKKKEYFKYNYIKDLSTRYLESLDYKCSGLYFKNLHNFSNNYLYIFPDCRSDKKVDNKKLKIKKIESDSTASESDISVSSSESTHSNENIDITRKDCRFMIKNTDLPDIYELYCSNGYQDYEKYSYACVPDFDTSKYLRSLFDEDEDDEKIFVECKYNTNFKKWIPLKKTEDDVDTINYVNSVQNCLDK